MRFAALFFFWYQSDILLQGFFMCYGVPTFFVFLYIFYYYAYFLVFSHRNISRLFMVLDSPLTFKEQITNSSAKAFWQVKGVRNRKWIDTQGVNGALYNEQAKK